MKISVIIPAHNEEKTIAACLQAITDADKPGGEFEIIVVNNASTDRTEEAVRAFPHVRLMAEPQKGLAKACECGRKHAHREILMYVDADTKISKHLIRYVKKKFEEQPTWSHCRVVTGIMVGIDSATPCSGSITGRWFRLPN